MEIKTLVVSAGVAALASLLFILAPPEDWATDFYFDAASLEGKRVVVAGASKGIGAEIAYFLAGHGAIVVISARNEAKLHGVASTCNQSSEPMIFAADLADETQATALIHFAVENMGGIDVLLINHAVFEHGAYVAPVLGVGLGKERWAMENMRRNFDVNSWSYVSLATAALPALVKSRGSIGVVSSLAGRFGMPKMALYSLCKHAIVGFFEALRSELILDELDVSVTIHTIGSIDTESARKATAVDMDMDALALASMWKSPKDAARSIVQNTILRRRESFFPTLEVRYLLWMHSWMPHSLDEIFASLHRKGK